MERIGVVPFWKSYDRKAVLRTARARRRPRLRLDLDSRGVGLRAVPAPDRDRARAPSGCKLATGIANVFSRSAGLLAMSAATLDEISEGRAILGLGTSGKVVVENFHGVPYEKPLTRLQETIGICRALWRGERLQPELSTLFDARHFKLEMTPLRAEHPDLRRVAAGEGHPRGRAASPTAGCRRSGRTSTSRTASRCSTRAPAPPAAIRRPIEIAPFVAVVPLDDVGDGARDDQAAGVVLHRRHGRLLPRALLPLRLRGERRTWCATSTTPAIASRRPPR